MAKIKYSFVWENAQTKTYSAVLTLRVFAEGFLRDPRTTPLVRMDDVDFTLKIVVPVIAAMAVQAFVAASRRRRRGAAAR